MTLFERMWRLRDAYRAVFQRHLWRREGKLTDEAVNVLRSLAQFCYAERSTFDPDHRIHALREGRREVWLEIGRILELDDEALLGLRQPDDE